MGIFAHFCRDFHFPRTFSIPALRPASSVALRGLGVPCDSQVDDSSICMGSSRRKGSLVAALLKASSRAQPRCILQCIFASIILKCHKRTNFFRPMPPSDLAPRRSSRLGRDRRRSAAPGWEAHESREGQQGHGEGRGAPGSERESGVRWLADFWRTQNDSAILTAPQGSTRYICCNRRIFALQSHYCWER